MKKVSCNFPRRPKKFMFLMLIQLNFHLDMYTFSTTRVLFTQNWFLTYTHTHTHACIKVRISLSRFSQQSGKVFHTHFKRKTVESFSSHLSLSIKSPIYSFLKEGLSVRVLNSKLAVDYLSKKLLFAIHFVSLKSESELFFKLLLSNVRKILFYCYRKV